MSSMLVWRSRGRPAAAPGRGGDGCGGRGGGLQQRLDVVVMGVEARGGGLQQRLDMVVMGVEVEGKACSSAWTWW